MPDELLERLRRFHDDAFPQYRDQFRQLVDEGQQVQAHKLSLHGD